jgi:hypothetical protein
MVKLKQDSQISLTGKATPIFSALKLVKRKCFMFLSLDNEVMRGFSLQI